MLLLVMNEHSCATDTPSRGVDNAMDEFLVVLRLVRRRRPKAALVTEEPVGDLPLAVDYSVRQWAADARNRDKWRYLLAIANKAPFRMVLPDEREPEDVEYQCAGRRVRGLATAHLVGGLAVSLPLDAEWDTAAIALERQWLDAEEDSGIELKSETVTVPHVSRSPHVGVHEDWIRTSTLLAVQSGVELWDQRADLFPNIQFLPGVEEQLAGLAPAHLAQVRKRLDELDKAAADWRPGESASPVWASKVTGESLTRAELCTWEDLDGVRREFGLHARYTGGIAGRIYFRLVPADGALRVAHVGVKRMTGNVPRRARR